MRLVRLSGKIVGKKLGKTIQTADGQVLLRAGTTLTSSYIKHLKRRGYQSIYIQDELVPDIEINDAINESTRLKATQAVAHTLQNVLQGRPVRKDRKRVNEVVENILSDLENNEDFVFCLSALRCADDYTFVHCVNTCVLALIIGTALHKQKSDLKTLGVGTILHDLGKLKISPSILNKPGSLTPEEFEQVKEHPRIGFDLLRKHFEINLVSAHVAFQHHERMDGTGYPRGLKGEEIHIFGRIAAVADVYDAITSDRIYRSRMDPVRAAELLKNAAGTKFDPRFIQGLLERIALFPNGSIVLLSTGEVGVVVRQDRKLSSRPVIRVVADHKYRLMSSYDLPLRNHPEITIRKILNDYPQKIKEQLARVRAKASTP